MPVYDAKTLLQHPTRLVHHNDRHTIHDFDVKQAAAMRLVKTALRNGQPLPNDTEELMHTLDTNRSHINVSLKSAKTDAYRRAKHQKTVSLAAYYNKASEAIDHAQEDALDSALDQATAKDEIIAFLDSANEPEREAFSLMVECQKLIAEGQSIPGAISSKLSRLRRQTGLALDLSLL